MYPARASILALLLCWAFAALADVAVPPLTGRVVDLTGTLDSGDIDQLTQKLKDLETRKGSQIAVLIVPTTEPETIEQFSIRVAEAWKIGRKKIDDGAVLVIAKNDRHLRIEVGYGLEGSLTDATSKRIIDEEITPRFKAGDFAGGVSAGIDRMIGVIDGEDLPALEPPQSQGLGIIDVDPQNPVVIISFLMVAGILRISLGRFIGSTAVGGLAAFLVWLSVGTIDAAIFFGVIGFAFSFAIDFPSFSVGGGRHRGGSSGWSSGSSSSSSDWSSSSSSDSGFSGGGGSFGGGGASGSW